MALFEDNLRTNYVPSELEKCGIIRRAGNLEVSLFELRNQLSSREGALRAVKQQKDALQTAVDQHRHLLSTARSLPDDILTMIFLFTLPVTHNAVMDINEPPLLLGRVCQRWRSIAFYTPRLWSSLHIAIPTSPSPLAITGEDREESNVITTEYDRKTSLQQASVKKWLWRSGSSPLSISLHPPFPGFLHTPMRYQQYLDLLIPHLRRLKNIEMTMHTFEVSSFFARITPEEVPILNSVQISFYGATRFLDTHPQAWHGSGLLHSRSLRSVQVTYFPFSTSPFASLWSRLTNLEILTPISPPGRLTLQRAHEILYHCTNLKQCSLDICDPSSDARSFLPISLQYLEHLYIIDNAPQLPALLHVFSAPSLNSVRFHTQISPVQGRRSPLLQLLGCSSVPIQRLSTDIRMLDLAGIGECLTLTPHLSHFRQEYKLGPPFPASTHPVDPFKAIFDVLIPDFNGHCYWKKLISIHVLYVSTVTDQDVLRFIVRRNDASASGKGIIPPKDIRIDLIHPMIEDIRPQVSRYTEGIDGLKLVLNYATYPRKGHFDWR